MEKIFTESIQNLRLLQWKNMNSLPKTFIQLEFFYLFPFERL